MAKKKGDPARLSQTDREWVWQTYQLEKQNKAATVRRTGFSRDTVAKVIREIEEENQRSPITRQARAEAAARTSARLQGTLDQIIDSITPEDIESVRIPFYDTDGKLQGYKYYGPNLLQKATSYGILTDKQRVQFDYENALLLDQNQQKMLMPGDIAGLLEAITGKIKSLGILNVQFENQNPDLVTKTQEVLAEVETVEQDGPDVITLDDMDGQ